MPAANLQPLIDFWFLRSRSGKFFAGAIYSVLIGAILNYLAALFKANVASGSPNIIWPPLLEKSEIPVILTFGSFTFVVGILYTMFKHLDEHAKNTEKAWEDFFKNRPIVLTIDVHKFDTTHITDLQTKFATTFPQNGTKGKICALDATSPRSWWSDSMLGYLAVQAAWKACDHPPEKCREISRIFVMHPFEMIHPLGVKLLTLHQLFGFSTYIIHEKTFEAIYLNLKRVKYSKVKQFGMKEFVIWENDGETIPLEYRGFRSYWDTLVEDEKRDMASDFDGKTAEKEPIKWREFDCDAEVIAYRDLFQRVCETAIECRTVHDVMTKVKPLVAKKKQISIKLGTTDVEIINAILQDFGSYFRS